VKKRCPVVIDEAVLCARIPSAWDPESGSIGDERTASIEDSEHSVNQFVPNTRGIPGIKREVDAQRTTRTHELH
jgi:hypothetical protein